MNEQSLLKDSPVNEASSREPGGFSRILNGKNEIYPNYPTPSQLPQPFSFLNLKNLMQPKQEVPEETTKAIEKTVINCNLSHVDEDHIFINLSINLAKYTKEINVNDICGVILLLKDPSPPIIINNANIQTLQSKDETAECTPDIPPHEAEVSISDEITIKNETEELANEPAVTISDDDITEDIIIKIEVEEPEKETAVTESDENIIKNEIQEPQCVNCTHCEESFLTTKMLKDHIRKNHPELFKYKCDICSKRYITQKYFQMHTKAHFHQCGYCESSFEHVVDYKTHLKEQHTDVFYRLCKPFFCEYCDNEFKGNKDDFLKHLRVHGNFICGICAEGFPTKQEQTVHLETHPDIYFCHKCDKGFKLKDSLKAHKVTHNNPYSFVCTLCKRGFKAKLALKVHIERVHMKKQAKCMCDKCSKMFHNPSLLSKHQKAVHEGRKDYRCQQCDKSFATIGNRDMHIKVMHLNEKPYQCEYCGKRFSRRNYVLDHTKLHHKSEDESSRLRGKSLDCQVCGKTFASTLTMTTHLKNVHLIVRKRRFKCKYCDLMFVNMATKKRHENLHKDPKNKFQCPVCLGRMENEEELKTHLAQHENPNSFICAVCEESFAKRPLLVAHIEKEHGKKEGGGTDSQKGNKNFGCQECAKSFASLISLGRHLKYSHNIVNTVKFKCRQCDLKFMCHKMKMKHEKLHGDPVNKFQCPICCIRKENKEELKTHLKEHEDPNKFICNDCNKTFSSRSLLDTHVDSEHRKNVENEKV